jgi:hypothetical protein
VGKGLSEAMVRTNVAKSVSEEANIQDAIWRGKRCLKSLIGSGLEKEMIRQSQGSVRKKVRYKRRDAVPRPWLQVVGSEVCSGKNTAKPHKSNKPHLACQCHYSDQLDQIAWALSRLRLVLSR